MSSLVMLSIFLLFSSFVLLSKADETEKRDNVLVLTKDNFDDVMNEHPFVLVDFYVPWCGHCASLAPHYEKAAEMVASENGGVLFAKLDATAESEIAEKHNITGYPTLKFRKQGNWIIYNGDLNADALKTWVMRKKEAAVKTINSVAEIEELTNSNQIVVVGFFKFQNNLATFEEAANLLDKYVFAATSLEDAFQKYDVKSDSQVTVFKPFDENRADYTGEMNSKAISDFVMIESIPLVVEFSQDTASDLFNGAIRKHFLAFLSKSGEFDSVKAGLAPIAKRFKGKLHFIVIDTDLEDHQRILDFLGMTTKDVPGYRVVDLADAMSKYKPDSHDFSESAVVDFIEDILSGKRKPFLISQPIPPESNQPVKQLVGLNYNEICKDKSKSVFVELYAPWCNHCKNLAPVWEELGQAFTDRDDIVIAKMDATANEAEGLSVMSYPTLMYYPKGKSEGIEYSGERKLEAFKDFVAADGKSDAPKKEAEQKDEL